MHATACSPDLVLTQTFPMRKRMRSEQTGLVDAPADGFASRACAFAFVLVAGVSCDDVAADGDGGGCCSEDDLVTARTDFEIFARGHSYFMDVEPGFACVPDLSVGNAYPGIDASAVYKNVSSAIVTSTEWASPGAPSLDGMIMLSDRSLGVGLPQDGGLFVVAEYLGPTPPALDAGFQCGGTRVASDTAVRELYAPLSDVYLSFNYDLSRTEARDLLETAYENAANVGTAQATQESFVGPRIDVAEAVVGDVDWPPPSLSGVDCSCEGF
jgi:hypothetical protein